MLIKDGREIENPWVIMDKDAGIEDALSATAQQVLVPARLWQEHAPALRENPGVFGVWLDSDEEAELLSDIIDEVPLVALNFPVFTDGRAFSTAFKLRHHLHYTGELRAIGDVQRDQLFYMKRCGIDAYDLAENVKLDDALSAFNDFNTSYQATVEEPLPLFRRR